MNKKQRIFFTLLITFIFPVHFFLAYSIDMLTGEPLGLWMLMPTSIILAVGVYFLSFKIWDKEKQESGEGEEQEPEDL